MSRAFFMTRCNQSVCKLDLRSKIYENRAFEGRRLQVFQAFWLVSAVPKMENQHNLR